MKVYLVELNPFQNRYSTVIRITERIRLYLKNPIRSELSEGFIRSVYCTSDT